MRIPRVQIGRLMVVVALLAVDLAALRATLPALPNPGLVVMVGILQALLVLPGAGRPGRLGFQAAGWAWVVAGFAAGRPAWMLTRAAFEMGILGERIARPAEMNQLLLFATAFHLALALVVASLGAWLARWLVARSGRSPGPGGGGEIR